MKELNEYRTRLIENLVKSAREFRTQCLKIKDPFASLEADGWNTHQVAAHTRDVDAMVYGMRAKRTAEEDNPEFQSFDADKHSSENYDGHEPLSKILDGLVTSVEALAATLKELPDGLWARESRHATLGGGFTVQAWVERDLAHIQEHTQTVMGTNK